MDSPLLGGCAMTPRWLSGMAAGVLGLLLWAGFAVPAHAQGPDLNRFFYYPYYYFPHNYWPSQGPKWPEPPGHCYQRPPAYMAYPPFREPGWHFDFWEP